MNVVLLKNNLKDGISIISGARKEISNLPILKNFLLEAKDDKLFISSTDLEIGVTHIINAKILKEGSITIPFNVFSQIINNLSFERITLESKNNSLFVTTDNYKANITTSNKSEFPIIPEIKENGVNCFTFNTEYLVQSLLSVVSSCQISNIRPELSGVLFSYINNEFKVVATDSFRLAEKTINNKKINTEYDGDISFIVPLKTIQEVIRIFTINNQKEEEIKIYFDKNQILFKTEKTSLISRLIEGKFPDYEPLIPYSFETEAVLEKEDLTSALKLTSSLSNRLNEIKFIIDESLKNIKIHSLSQEFGESEYILSSKIKGNAQEIAFNWKYLLDGLKNIKTTNVNFGFNGENKPSLIKSPDDTSLLYILMPIKSS